MSTLLTRRHVLTAGTQLAGAAALSSALGGAALLASESANAAPLQIGRCKPPTPMASASRRDFARASSPSACCPWRGTPGTSYRTAVRRSHSPTVAGSTFPTVRAQARWAVGRAPSALPLMAPSSRPIASCVTRSTTALVARHPGVPGCPARSAPSVSCSSATPPVLLHLAAAARWVPSRTKPSPWIR
jgi:hypothetical protein